MITCPANEAPQPAFRLFEARIAPEVLTSGRARQYASIPRGHEPANGGRRPVLAAFSVAIFLFAAWTQSERWADCRSEGGTRVGCFLQPGF